MNRSLQTNRYDREAPAYRELWAPVVGVAGVRLLRELGSAPARRILDVGAGVGSLWPGLQRRFAGAFVAAFDRSLGMLALAPREVPRGVMDAAHLGVAPACVDVVLLVLVLFHLQRPAEGLREARRVLRPGGRVATATWGSELQSRAARVWADCLDAHGAKEDDPVQQARHEPVSTPEKLETLLRVAELTPERCWAEEVVARCDLEKFVSIHTRLGPAKARFDSLAPGARTAFLAASRRRLAELAPEDFVARGQVVYSLASA